ncbi:uncharacterized protein BKA78DRAFT_125080 [Phyllosticta capitalensis]|uniref:uncharacterized protein n=1 Tax=Phyllosticta capitalensis TaxID=121624 RepID=UPI00312FD81E
MELIPTPSFSSFSSKNQRIICYDGQTIMDTVLTRNRMYQPLEKSVGVDVIEDVSVDQILNDCGFLPLKVSLSVDKDAVSKSPGRLSYKFVTRLSNCPDVAEEMGCPDHYLAIFRKSLDRLHTCTQKGVDWTRRHEGLPEPIACALGWPEGLSFLLNLDLDAKSAVATARIQGITEAIRILISHQVPPFYQSTPGFPGVSILAPYEDEETRNLVFQYVADARKELAQLGLQNLERGTPEWEHLQHLSRTGTLVDERALEIWKALEASQKVPAPKLRHLWPGESKSVYFDSCIIPHEFYSADSGEHDFYFEKNQNIVQSLLSLGFHNIDVAEEDGTTLFLKACSQSQIDWASYFLSNGAQPDPKGLWLAVRAFWGWNHRLPHPNWLMRLASKASCDSCRCHCSTSGCTPAAVLARRCLLGRSQRRHELISFTERMSLRSRRVAMRELCRLEVFEKLGMTHTCCSRATGWAPLKDDDAAAIHDEEENLKDTLEVFMSLFDHLFSQFDGRFNVFLRAWWAALELYLPEEDLDTSTVGYRGNKSHWLKLFADLHVEGPEQSKIIDDSGIFNVVCHFHVVVDPLARRFDAEDPNFFVADERLCRYLETLGVPDYTFQWMKMARDHTGWPDQEVHRPVKWRYTEQDDIKDGFPFTRDYIVPLIAAGIIRDIERDAWFPEELRELLENEGVIVSGKLRPAHWKEGAEDVFERHRDMFEEQGSSSSI